MYKIIEKIKKKQENLKENAPITIVCIGDSITQGCFECYMKTPTALETVFDYNSAYSTRLRELFALLYPNVQVNVINSGISGDNALGGLARLERDVFYYNPDLVIVSFGLNDSYGGPERLYLYTDALEKIFKQLAERNIDCIFLTENCMNTVVSCHLKEEKLIEVAKDYSRVQNAGFVELYFETAKKVCEKYSVKVCDMYPIWKTMEQSGIEVTELLANKLNHPIREFHYYIAIKLLEIILFG